ncbi:hypothetical protein BWZ43_25685 [Heyndrickxia oleronia]|uniref:Uncharacterized protein n=1 Tax=Heyndrickxia oleronia TaxID=38875 RepID=A0A8E2LCY5_9BACI|nr:hypothetical protein BWZ43_25685 [Heyndrickxia oleronia]
MQIIIPLVLLILCMVSISLIYWLVFRWLPKLIFNFLLGPIALLGAYIWAFPMNMGFYEFFK